MPWQGMILLQRLHSFTDSNFSSHYVGTHGCFAAGKRHSYHPILQQASSAPFSRRGYLQPCLCHCRFCHGKQHRRGNHRSAAPLLLAACSGNQHQHQAEHTLHSVSWRQPCSLHSPNLLHKQTGKSKITQNSAMHQRFIILRGYTVAFTSAWSANVTDWSSSLQAMRGRSQLLEIAKTKMRCSKSKVIMLACT